MQLVDPVAAPAAAPEPASAPVAVKARPKVRKDQPRRAKRISSPLLGDTVDDSVRVIAQDSTLNEFNVPLARPEEAQEKSVDVKEAQDGDDDGDAAPRAALEAAAAIAGKLRAEEEDKALRLAEQEKEQEKAKEEEKEQNERERLAAAQRQLVGAQAERKKLDEERRQAAQLAQQEQLKRTEQDAVLRERLLAEQREQQQLEQQRADQLRQEQQRQELAKAAQRREEQLQAEQLRAEQQRAEQQRAEQQRAEQQRAEQQRAEQQRAEQKRAEQQRAEQQRAEQQRAEQQRAEQQRAEQQRAGEQAAREAAQRSADLAGTEPGSGSTGPAAGAGSGPAQIPKNMMGSDAANRAREMVRGLDLLRGAPPASRSRGDRRIAVGAGERDLPLRMYAESWRQKIERNGAVNYPRSWADAVRIDPLVSVAVRSDGSVEGVTIIVSSGRADMDEAVRRIVRVNARYSPFPPQIAERYDVIEIRRVWRFDDQLRLLEEVR